MREWQRVATVVGVLALAVSAAVGAQGDQRIIREIRDGGNDTLEKVRALIAAGVDVNSWDSLGETALHRAVIHERGAAVIEALLDAGADLGLRNGRGLTPLGAARDRGRAAHVVERWQARKQAEREREAAQAAAQRRIEALEREAAAEDRALERLRLELEILQARAATGAGAGAGLASSFRAEPVPRACEIPGYPRPTDVATLGLDWCPGNVSIQHRAFALQAAGAWCAITGGSSSTPEQIATRHAEIRETCDRLDALGIESCQCPAGYRP